MPPSQPKATHHYYSHEKRPVGAGYAYIAEFTDLRYLPLLPWPDGTLDLVVLHLRKEPTPEVVALLYRLRLSLGESYLCLALHRHAAKVWASARPALQLTGHRLVAATANKSFSCWAGNSDPPDLPVVKAAPILRHGDLSRKTAKAVLRPLRRDANVLEIFPRHGRLTLQAVSKGLTPTVYTTAASRQRLISFLDERTHRS